MFQIAATLTDTLLVLTQCYAAAFGVTDIWSLDVRLIDTTTVPTLLAYSQTAAPVDSITRPRARITYNTRTLAVAPDSIRRQTVIHELLHVYWAPIQVAAVAFKPDARQLIENLTSYASRRPMYQRICGARGSPREEQP